jgi:lipoprotein-releasing system permease protein
VQALDVVLVAGSAIVISFAATVFPSLQAAKLEPVAALRYE